MLKVLNKPRHLVHDSRGPLLPLYAIPKRFSNVSLGNGIFLSAGRYNNIKRVSDKSLS